MATIFGLLLVNRSAVLPISRVGCVGVCCPVWRRPEEDGCGRSLGSVEGGCFVDAGDAEAPPAADFAAPDIEAVGADGLLPLAYDASEGGASLAFAPSGDAEEVSTVLDFGEQLACPVRELFAAAEVDGALAAGDSVGDAVVGAVSSGAACAVAGDDGAALGEDLGVVVDEVEWCGHGWLSGVRSRESGRGWWAA